ncbi:MAG: hypothetical protein U0176_18880 [Bacteroidia bacterium]
MGDYGGWNNTLNLRGIDRLQGSDRVNEGNSVGLRPQVPLEPLRGISLRSNMSGRAGCMTTPCRRRRFSGGGYAVQALRVFGSPESDVTCNTFQDLGRGCVCAG